MIQNDLLLEVKLLKYAIKNKLYFLKLDPSLFTNSLTSYAYNLIKKYFEETKKLPSIDYLRVELSSNGIAKPAEAFNLISAIEKAKDTNDFHVLLKKSKELKKIRDWSEKLNKALQFIEKGKIKELEKMFTIKENYETIETNIKPATLKHVSNIFEKNESISTGFKELDKVLEGGFGRGELTVVIAPPKAAKSTFMINCWFNAYRKGFKSLLISLELPEITIEKRLISMLTETKYSQLKNKNLTAENEKFIREHFATTLFGKNNPEIINKLLKKYENLPLIEFLQKVFKKRPDKDNLIIYSTPLLNINDILHEIYAISPDIIFVDYLSWLEPSRSSKNLLLWEKLGLVAKELKAVARQTDAALVTAAHLNEDTKNIRYSKMVGEHADLVFKWELEQDGIIKTFKVESLYTRNIAPFDNIYMFADLEKQKIDIKFGAEVNETTK